MFSFELDLTRPLRAEPVRRDEVLIERWTWKLMTMPAGTFGLEERTQVSQFRPGTTYMARWLVGAPALWRPLLDELAKEMAADLDRRWEEYETARREGAKWVAIWGDYAKEHSLPKPEFRHDAMREYHCDHCGCRYLSYELTRGRRVRVCSNRCEHDRRSAQRRAWRDWRDRYRPLPDYPRNATRTKRRAEARTGRTCGHCGVPIEAARSTRRFCSGICRVRAHREKLAAL